MLSEPQLIKVACRCARHNSCGEHVCPSFSLFCPAGDITFDNLKARVRHVEGVVRGDGCDVFAALAKLAVDTIDGAGLHLLPLTPLKDVLSVAAVAFPAEKQWSTIGGSKKPKDSLGMKLLGGRRLCRRVRLTVSVSSCTLPLALFGCILCLSWITCCSACGVPRQLSVPSPHPILRCQYLRRHCGRDEA